MARMKYTGPPKKIRRPSRFKSHKHLIRICKTYPTHGATAQEYIKRLHKNQGRKGHVKLPGYKHKYFLDSKHRIEAREGSKQYRRVVNRLNARHRRARRQKAPGNLI